MRRVVLLALLAMALPLAARANSIDVGNKFGTITGSASGLSLSGSILISYGSSIGSNLGTLTFTTGAFISGDVMKGGTLAPGGTFVITGNGTNGVPMGVIFSGTFSSSSPVMWTLTTLSNGTHSYTLSGAIEDAGGRVGATTQLTVNVGKGFFNGSATLSSGNTNLSVPEPATLGLLGTGLVGIAGLMRRKLRIG
jgi:hypothetical protein